MGDGLKALLSVLLGLVWVTGCGSHADASDISMTVDARHAGHSISPYIYGSNMVFEDRWDGLHLRLPFGRLGGNQWTAYNWEVNASNAGVDAGHQNSGWLGGGDQPGGAVSKRLNTILGTGASALVTVNMLDFVAADKQGGADVNLSPQFLQTRFRASRTRKQGAMSLTPNTSDKVVYQDEFVHWVLKRFDPSRIFFSLDNEPDLWDHTHPRLRGQKVSYEEVRRRSVETASRIKEISRQSLVFGPALSGYMGFMKLGDAPDHGGRIFYEYYLQEMRKAESATGKRLLDVLDLHWYPEHRGANNVRIIEKEHSKATIRARLQAPRSLWDPTFKENSWITNDVSKEPVRLIPRVRESIQKYYPGTRLAFTEYYYGGGDHVSGAVAQADVLGIFGREQVFAATWWPWHFDEDPRYIQGAFLAYLNFDGQGGRFGDIAIPTQTNDPSLTSIYASKFSSQPDRRVLVVINKDERTQRTVIHLKGAENLKTARTYVINSKSAKPAPGPSLKAVAKGVFEYDMPALSVTTILLTP